MTVHEARKALGTQRWRRMRLFVLERDGRRCTECGGARELQVHHRKPREERPDLVFEPSNLAAVCRPCHEAKHRPVISAERMAWRNYALKEVQA